MDLRVFMVVTSICVWYISFSLETIGISWPSYIGHKRKASFNALSTDVSPNAFEIRSFKDRVYQKDLYFISLTPFYF